MTWKVRLKDLVDELETWEPHMLEVLRATPEAQRFNELMNHISYEGLFTSIKELRSACNKRIKTINSIGANATPGFREINELLQLCDKVFAAVDSIGDVNE